MTPKKKLNKQRFFSQSLYNGSNPSHEIVEYTEAYLKKQTLKQLRVIAKTKDIRVPRGAKKDLIVQLILSNQSRESNKLVDINFQDIADELRLIELNRPVVVERALKKIKESETLAQKCILARKYLKSESLKLFEVIVRKDLELEKAKTDMSGDATKKNTNYEIKVSVHGRFSDMNFVQIRP